VLQDLEEEAELGHLHRLAVDVHAVDVVEKDAFLLPRGEIPLPSSPLVDRHLGLLPGDQLPQGGLGDDAFEALLGEEMLHIPIPVVVEEIGVGPDQERAGAAGRVEDLELLDLFRRLLLAELADGVLDDVVHDVGRRVIDAAGLADLRLLFDLGVMAGGEADHLSQELLVDVPEDIQPQDRKFVGAFRIIEVIEDLLENLVVDLDPGGERIGRGHHLLLFAEMEEA